MREGLAHAHACLNDDAFFKLIDATGGWPAGYEYVGFEHTSERAAGFTNSNQNTGWWTTLNSQDDYYLWKLSPKALQRIVDAERDSFRDELSRWVHMLADKRAELQAAESQLAELRVQVVGEWSRTIRALHLAVGLNPGDLNADALLGKVVALATPQSSAPVVGDNVAAHNALWCKVASDYLPPWQWNRVNDRVKVMERESALTGRG